MALKTMMPEEVKMFVIHCSATQPHVDVGATDIDRWHRQRGFLKIGYHYVIRRNGGVETGRSLDEPGAHAQGVNHKSIGICLVGGLDSKGRPANNFTDEQWSSLETLLKSLRTLFPHVKTILGHRDLHGVKKDCPCFDVRTVIEDWGL